MTVVLVIEGLKPKTQGSMRALPFHRKNGKLGVRVIHQAEERVREWRLAVRYAAMQEWQKPPTDRPVDVNVLIFAPRPRSHFAKHGLSAVGRRSKAPGRTVGDVDKILRSVLDALTGVVYHDDSQVATAFVQKQWLNRRGVHWQTNISIDVYNDASEEA